MSETNDKHPASGPVPAAPAAPAPATAAAQPAVSAPSQPANPAAADAAQSARPAAEDQSGKEPAGKSEADTATNTAANTAPHPEAEPAATEGLAYRRAAWWPRWPQALAEKESRNKLLVGGLLLLLLLQWWNSRTDISDLRREVAQRLQTGDNINSQTKLIADRVDDELKVLQGKVSVLEARQIESQSQQIALEQLYRDLAKNRDDWALAEIEQVLSTASQQLQLAGNLRGALIALQNADARLSRADRPQFIAIRRAIAKDMDNLKSLPSVDLTGTSVRIDTLIGQIDSMPLLADEKPAVVVHVPKTRLVAAPKTELKSPYDWRVEMQDRWDAWSADLWNDIKQLVRLRTVTTPEALLLSPGESFFARENLKLRLLNARLALLSRNDAAFRSDLAEADRALVRYFDIRDKHTQAGRELIKQLKESVLNIEMPTLSNSLAAVRQSRTRP